MTPETDLTLIRKQVLDATTVMFERALKDYPNSIQISDQKEEVENTTLSASGPLQDCEFGMALLLVASWLKDEFFENSGIAKEKFEWAVKSLVESTVVRLLKPDLKNEGGRGNHVSFFTGEPYTQHSRGKKYSANLDAAMIAIAFLTLAVQRFDEQIANIRLPQFKDVQLPEWTQNLRDAVLFIIIEGLEYALQCRVKPNEKFLGFTCDPDSNQNSPADGGLDLDVDRLFFTWTACETINDVTTWRSEYLEPRSPALPAPATSRLNDIINDLQGTLREAADWCSAVFFEQFRDLTIEDPTELVEDIRPLGRDGVPSAAQQEAINRQRIINQHVYHLSQYAAIRSLVPRSVSIEEVRTISDKLDVLVKQSILGSGLDEAVNPKLFTILTREYELGKSNPDPYVDDAWYPLVMRSLSGLLSRTLEDFGARIGTRFTEQEVLELVASFRRSLAEHFRNLIKRRPTGGAGGPDGKLWSYLSGQPYVLYATQRTIFALMKYDEFLKAVDQFQTRQKEETDSSDGDLSSKLARRFAETYFKPIINELLLEIPRSADGQLLLPVNSNGQNLPMPNEPWAKDVIRTWMEEFTTTFESSKVKSSLAEKANWLTLIRECVEKYEPSKDLPPRKRNGVDENLQKLKEEYNKICKVKKVGEELLKQPKWGDDELTPILFDHLFRNCVQRATGSIEELSKNSTELWKLIKDAIDIRDNLKNLDPTGVP